MSDSTKKRPLFRIILGVIVSVEIGAIILSMYGLYKRSEVHKNILGVARVVPIRKEFLITSPSAELKYFWEASPSATETDNPEWLPYEATYTINDDSLNERFNYTTHKPSSVFRIMALGDSFTFGHFVDTKDNWTEQLEDKLNHACSNPEGQKFEVINLGERGYDVKYAAHRLLTRGMKYRPDLIVYFEPGFGFERIRELLDPLIEKYKKEIKPEEHEIAQKNNTYYLAWQKASDEIQRTYTRLQLFEEVHQAWLELLSVRGQTRIIVASFDTIAPVDKAKLKLWTMGQTNVLLFHGVHDLHKENGMLPDGHPNAAGHQIIANDIYGYLTNNHFVRCQ